MKQLSFLILFFITICCKGQEGEEPQAKTGVPFRKPVFSSTVYDSSINGYYFLIIRKDLVILDKYGAVVYFNPVVTLGAEFFLLPDGRMCYSDPGKFYFMDSTFSRTDSIWCRTGTHSDLHEMLLLPHGHYLMLGVDSFDMDLTNHKIRNYRYSDTTNIRCAAIQELDSNRDVVFEWHGRDHYNIDDVDSFFVTNNKLVDWTHANAMELDTDGNILLSNRNMNEITKISRKDGSIIWRWGGKRNQFRFINCPVPFYGQHDIRRLSNGHFTLFDNGLNTVPHGARAMEFELDEKNKTATLVWSYTFDSLLYSSARGSVQKGEDGKTVVCLGGNNRQVCFVVIDSNKKLLLTVKGLNPYRVLHYDSLPWRLHRPAITCFDSLGVKYLNAGAGHNEYHWSTGDSTQIIRAVAGSAYSVFVPYGEDGFISSELFTFSEATSPCAGMVPARQKKTGR